MALCRRLLSSRRFLLRSALFVRRAKAVLISTDGVSDRNKTISASGSALLSKAASEVSSYWHSHTIPFDPSRKDNNKRIESFFAWSIELCGGTLISRSVPYIKMDLAARYALGVRLIGFLPQCNASLTLFSLLANQSLMSSEAQVRLNMRQTFPLERPTQCR